MEPRERRKLEDRLRQLLQIEGELKKQEKDLATKVFGAAAAHNLLSSSPVSRSPQTFMSQ